MADNTQPIIIRKIIEESGHAHHGGAWKVAYADFVTAMMAFFLMLWLLSTSDEQTLKGLADYFSEAQNNTGEPGGVGGMFNGVSALTDEINVPMPPSPFNVAANIPLTQQPPEDVDPFALDLSAEFTGEGEGVDASLTDEAFEAEREAREQEQFEEAKAAIVNALSQSSELREYADSLVIDQTREGLRIQILDRDGRSMFPVASADMLGHTRKLVGVVVKAIAGLPQKISIRGHTDSRPFAAGSDYDNWRLSSDRANATREALIAAGLPSGRIAEVIGRADAEHLYPDDPLDPRNRRISLVLMREAPGGGDEQG